jgi:hypothetical protein
LLFSRVQNLHIQDYHKLNFYEVRAPWLGAGAFIQTFAELWEDTGLDGLVLGDVGYTEADKGEGNGRWDDGENFTDANENGKWDAFREPEEFSAYIQNTFEVPWMVIHYGLRIDAVDYNTQIWADSSGEFKKKQFEGDSDDDDDGEWDQGVEQVSDAAGIPHQKVFLKDSGWLYKISPRILQEYFLVGNPGSIRHLFHALVPLPIIIIIGITININMTEFTRRVSPDLGVVIHSINS